MSRPAVGCKKIMRIVPAAKAAQSAAGVMPTVQAAIPIVET